MKIRFNIKHNRVKWIIHNAHLAVLCVCWTETMHARVATHRHKLEIILTGAQAIINLTNKNPTPTSNKNIT